MHLSSTKTASLILLLLFAFQFKSYSQQLDLSLKFDVELKHTIHPIYQSSFSSFGVHGDVFAITTESPVELAVYSISTGQQIFYKHLEGDGPFEIRNPERLQVSDNRVDIINRTGKIISLDLQGNNLFEAETGVQFVKDLLATENNFIITTDSPVSEHHAHLYYSDEERIKTLDISQKVENALMSPLNESGDIFAVDRFIYIVEPHGSIIHQFDNQNLNLIKRIELDIPNFKKSPAEAAFNVYFDDMEALNSFLGKNSTISTGGLITDGILIEVFHAHKDFSGRDLLLYDQDFNLLCMAEFPRELKGVKNPKIHAIDNGLLYFYREEIDTATNDVKMYLSAYNVSCN